MSHSKKLSPISKASSSRRPYLSSFLKAFNPTTPGGSKLPGVERAFHGQVLVPSRPVAETVGSTSTSQGGIGAGKHNDGYTPLPAPDYRLGADSPSALDGPTMPRAGARYPDAAEQNKVTSEPNNVQMDSDDVVDEPVMDDEVMYATINEYLQLEEKFQPRLYLPEESDNVEVTTGARDGAAHVLRCLKVWFDLPAEVLIHAINLFDRFLSKMKVRPCHLPCICVSSMNIAIDQHAANTQQDRKISIQELVSVSQSACTARDVARMSNVMADKLGLTVNSGSVTAWHWLKLLRSVLSAAATQLQVKNVLPAYTDTCTLLELVLTDTAAANARAPEIALVILFHKLEQKLGEMSRAHATPLNQGPAPPTEAYRLFELATQLASYCHMSSSSVAACTARVGAVEARYEARAGSVHRQTLVWRLSERTLKLLRPTDRLTSLLPTIQEQHQPATDRNRSGSESSESEETSDWPRSPVLPVYCDN